MIHRTPSRKAPQAPPAAARIFDHLLAAGNHGVPLADRLASLDWLEERKAHLDAGQADALASFRRAIHALLAELGPVRTRDTRYAAGPDGRIVRTLPG